MSASGSAPPAPRALFLAALELPPSEREAYLARNCGEDAALREQVSELLREHENLGAFLQTPALAETTRLVEAAQRHGPESELVAPLTERPGDRIGRYKLLQVIGEGGCGIVYMAEQEEPVRRRVALKVIKLGMDTRAVIARFEAERQALAMMDHPNIAKVLDGGATETGRPYFVMELVRGVRVTAFCDENRLSTPERLQLFLQVCQAIQHAHQKGIIHRDIKPSNILVTLHDGRPVPKVIDFGIAKATEQRLTDKTLFTEFSTFIGTPAYMSPEQAEMSGLDIDTRSDIYSLGVLLYELLTGRTPFDAEALLRSGLDECRRTICEQEPARPSTRLATLQAGELHTTAQGRRTEPSRLIHSLRGDLDWVVMKCLEKDRTRRYATANDLALDVHRYLEDEPVEARPPSNLYRLGKLLRRHRGAVAATLGIAATLLIGAGVSGWQAVRAIRAERAARGAQRLEGQLRRQAEQERERAEHEESLARLNEYVADINLAQQSLAAGHLGRALQLLEKHRPKTGEPDLRSFEWRYLWQLCQGDPHVAFPGQARPVQSVALSPQGNVLAVGFIDKLFLYDTATKNLLASMRKGGLSLAFLPGGQSLISGSPSTVRVWRTSDWTEQQALSNNFAPLALSPDGARLATMSRDGVRLWDTASWKEIRVLPGAFGPMAFAPDGRTLVSDSRSGLTVWPVQEQGPPVLLEDSTNLFVRGGPPGPWGPWARKEGALAFAPDGASVIAARNSLSDRGVFVLSIWNASSGKEIGVLPEDPEHIEHTGAISCLAFSPDGRLLATGSFDHSVRLWDFAARRKVASLQGHLSEVLCLAFSKDGQSLASGSDRGDVKLWPTQVHGKDDVIPGRWGPLAFSRDGGRLALLNREYALVFLNLDTREPEGQIQLDPPSGRGRGRFGPFPQPSLSADLGTLAVAEEGSVQLWNTETREVTTLKSPEERIDFLALSPDARSLVTGSRGRALRFWDLTAGTNDRLPLEAHRVLFSPDSATLSVFQSGNRVRIWDLKTRAARTNFVEQHLAFGASAAFSPDGRLLALVCQDDSIRLWDTTTARPAGECIGHKQNIFSVVFAPDGKTLATTSEDSTLKFWNVATQQELLTIPRLGGAMRELLFSPDGRYLIGSRGVFSRNGDLRIYQAPTLAETDAAARP